MLCQVMGLSILSRLDSPQGHDVIQISSHCVPRAIRGKGKGSSEVTFGTRALLNASSMDGSPPWNSPSRGPVEYAAPMLMVAFM